jgi:hypothetical protein
LAKGIEMPTESTGVSVAVPVVIGPDQPDRRNREDGSAAWCGHCSGQPDDDAGGSGRTKQQTHLAIAVVVPKPSLVSGIARGPQ